MSIDTDTLLISVNNRLARALQARYDQQQAASGKRTWPTANILPWSAWLIRSYEYLVDHGYCQRVLLNSHQERLLWEKIVRQSHQGESLLRPNAAAQSAQQAWQLQQDWQLSENQLAQYRQYETDVFLHWQQQFKQHCQQHQFITQAELCQALKEQIEQQHFPLTGHIQLHGFDSFSPQQESLFATMRTQGCQLDIALPKKIHSQIQRTTLATFEDEVYASAHWAKQYLAQNPQSQIAIVSPQIIAQRETMLRILREVVDPHSLLPGQTTTTHFNLALGQALANYPLVAQLLLALKLSQNQTIPLQEISVVLRSPFIGGHKQESAQRAMFDWHLHDDGLPQITAQRLLKRAQQFDELSHAQVPDFIQRINTLRKYCKRLPKQASPNAWSGHLLDMLETLGWPGDYSLDSEEYQQAERLRRLISEFSALSCVQTSMSFTQALQQFKQLCSNTIFQAQSRHSQLQVIGTLEATGLAFDAVWVCGMNEEHWPPFARPNPLLPIHLQREQQMPHASSQRELAFAQQQTERLKQSAKTVIMSYAQQSNGQASNPSPLLKDMVEIDSKQLVAYPDDGLQQAALAVGSTDELPAPIASAPAKPPSGGSHLLSAQAACPFQATARFRLQANTLNQPQSAPDARLQGQILHQLLQQVWQEIQTSEQLNRMDEPALLACVQPYAEKVLRDLGRKRPDVFTEAFISLETDRLSHLVSQWLQLEQQRQTPFKVQQLEQRQTIELHGLPLRLQADRVDQLADGSVAIIDYKSGAHSKTLDWTAERPSELQIPLYCTQTEQPAAALVAQIHNKKVQFRGTALNEDIAPGIKAFAGAENISDWQGLLSHWQQTLEQLADEILKGRSDIAPSTPQACTYCGLQSLCRNNTGQP
jgi:ATP-dependent helicase/nuclease subunit B